MKALSTKRRHPLATLAVLVLGLVGIGAAYASIVQPGRADAASSSQSLAIDEGKKLYDVGCSSCHGTGAQGTSDGPSLIGVGAAAVDFQVGTGRMPLAKPDAQAVRRPPQYTQPEIDQLAAYVASLGPGPAIPNASEYDPTGADAARGGELFRTNCAMCHNASGQGGALTQGKFAPSLMDVSPKHIYEATVTGPEAMPVFSNQTVTPQDKRDIIAYIDAMKTETNRGGYALGRVGPVTEGLAGWILGIGSLVGLAVWLGAKAR